MAQYTLSEILSPETADSMLTTLLTQLASGSFPSTNWETSSTVYQILKAEAITLADLSALQTTLAGMPLLGLSSGTALSLLAQDNFQLIRFAPRPAIISITVAILPGNPSKTIQPAGLTITIPSGLMYVSNNTAPVSIPNTNTPVSFHMVAQSTGILYNLVNLTTTLIPVTTIPGAIVNSVDTGSGTPFIQQGYDGESDSALTVRCQDRWTTQAMQATKDKLTFIATNAGTSTIPTRVSVDDNNPDGPGTARVYVFGPSGPLSAADIALIQTPLNVSGSICEQVLALNADSSNIVISGSIYLYSAFNNDATKNNILGNISENISATPIAGTIWFSQIEDAIQSVQGVRNIENLTINGVASDLILAAHQAPVLQPLGLTYFSV